MSTQRESVSIKLTADQKEAIRQAIGKTGDELTLSIEELEQRIAPARLRM